MPVMLFGKLVEHDRRLINLSMHKVYKMETCIYNHLFDIDHSDNRF